MPIYDYICELGCGTHEARRGYDEVETYCPKCGGPAHRKSVYHVSAPGDPQPGNLREYVMRGARFDPTEVFKNAGTVRAKERFQEQREELAYNGKQEEERQQQTLPGPNYIASEAARALGIDPHGQSGLMRKEIRRRGKAQAQAG